MNRYFLAFLAVLLIGNHTISAQDNQPKADNEAVVVSGNARFTILTSRLVRMEWAEDGVFEDRATLAIVNRKLPVPEFKVSKRNRKTVIITDFLKLTYLENEKFDAKNLKVEFLMDLQSKDKVVWYPGKDDSGNLLGTTRTLDKCDGINVVEPYDPGVISKDGWAVIDESERHLLVEDDSDWKEWVERRNGTNRQDLYLFAYGHDYRSAVGDFTRVAGKIPLPPKYAFGYWWSRYWQYSDAEFVDLARQFRTLGIPIDVMVIDMDWHETWSLNRHNPPKDEFGERIGWTGYTWQKELFPEPENFLQEIHDMGMKTSLNLHPASGIQPYEDCYDRFVADYTGRTDNYDGPEGYAKDGKEVPVPFRISDRDWTDAYFNSVIHPLEKMGVDFWWLDWQQWKYCKYMEGLNNTFWLNHTFFHDKIRQSAKEGIYAERPMIYHRWGGLGSHRYQIGFSGDTFDSWKVLSYLPYFTSTAANVGYGYWGHDIGGHMQQTPHKTDPELYMRWLQYGVFTPIFKTHSTKSIYLERRMWMFPEYFDSMKEAVRLRYSLSPYIYSAARQTYDTGISICRPMYYDYPENEKAYTEKEQFMFGDDILATALCQPADSLTGLTEREMWFPEGSDWYDMATGAMYEGGESRTLHYTLNENPYYVKAGSIIPMASEDISSLQEKSNEINLFIAPGWNDASTEWYEDDGATQAYSSEYARTPVLKKTINGNGEGKSEISVKILPREGSYRDMDPMRKISLTFGSCFAPEKILVDGKEITYSRFAANHARKYGFSTAEWTYDGRELAVKVYLPETSAEEATEVKCIFSSETVEATSVIYGKKGLLKRMFALSPEVKYIVGQSRKSLNLSPVRFLKVAQGGSYITAHPDEALEYLQEIDIEDMVGGLRTIVDIPEDFIRKARAHAEL